MSLENWEIRLEKPQDAIFIAELLERAFGAGRFAKAAYRLREGRAPVRALSFVALKDGVMAGSVRFWPVVIGKSDALMLGPIATSPKFRNQGAAAALITHSCEQAKVLGHARIILVGDLDYYQRVGFQTLNGAIHFPAPVDYTRVLVRPLVAGAQNNLSGKVLAPTTPSAKFCGYESVLVQ